MNEYHFADMFVGMTASFSYIVTEEKMSLFRELSGDENPLHVDADFAKAHGFLDKVVYGMLSASLISKLGGIIFRVSTVSFSRLRQNIAIAGGE